MSAGKPTVGGGSDKLGTWITVLRDPSCYLVGGAVAAVIGAAIWAGVTVATGYQIGFMAIGVGILVGFAVRLTGKGEAQVFGFIGGAFALLGCVLGNLFIGIAMIAKEYELAFFEALLNFDYTAAPELLSAMFSPMDLLFYGIAVWEGFKFAILPEGSDLEPVSEI